LATLLYGAAPAWAQSAPPLDAVASFAVLGGSGVTAAGPAGTVIGGDVGSSPTPQVTGFPPAVVTAGFTVYTAATAVTANARAAATNAYGNLAGQGCTVNVAADLALLPQPLAPGVYCMGAGGLTGAITLSGDADDIWVFKTASSLTTAGASNITMSGGANSCNVFWQITTTATLGASSTFRGSLFAGAAVNVGTNVDWTGRAIAGSLVSLDGSDRIGGCSTQAAPPPSSCPTITFTPPTLPGGTVGVAYNQTLTGSGGNAPYHFTVAAGALPAGVTLASSSPGVLAGTPTTAGTFTFTLRATDANGCFVERPYSIVVAAAPVPPAACPPITITPATLPNAAIGVAITQTLAGSGGTGPYTFGVTTGTLPAGVTLTPAGVLSGTPTTLGTSTFTIRGTDVNGCFAERTFTVSIVTAVPTLPQIFLVLLALALAGIGYLRLRQRARAA
jgi:hypothetical protein